MHEIISREFEIRLYSDPTTMIWAMYNEECWCVDSDNPSLKNRYISCKKFKQIKPMLELFGYPKFKNRLVWSDNLILRKVKPFLEKELIKERLKEI